MRSKELSVELQNRIVSRHRSGEGHSTCSALTQVPDALLKEIDSKTIVGAVLLDFNAAFDVIDDNPLPKCRCYGFAPSA